MEALFQSETGLNREPGQPASHGAAKPADSVNNEAEVAWLEHCDALRGFLQGVLRDEHAAADCLQQTFSKLVESGGPPVAGNLRGWLFRVALNFARQLQRRQSVERRGLEKVAIMRQLADCAKPEAGEELIRRERLDQAREAVRRLSIDQQAVLRMRIEEGLKFAEIADRLGLPLGTVLTRMRRALETVRRYVQSESPDEHA